MNNRITLIGTAALAAALTLTACSKTEETPAPGNGGTSMDDVQRKTGDAMNEAGNFLSQKKDEFVAMWNGQSETFNEQMATLKARAKELEGDARQRIDETIASLEQRTTEFRQKLTELKNASGDAWQEMQAGLKKSGEELKQAYLDAIDEFSAG